MKTIITLLLLTLGVTVAFGQEDNDSQYVGDNFSLEGALDIFKKSNTVEEFEQLINQENNDVNNLDLNNDGNIDYITVNDIANNDSHILVLSTYLDQNDKQDIATIAIEKTGNEQANLQIEGNEELYAQNTFVEPYNVQEQLENKSGPNIPQVSATRIVVNVWAWPCVKFIYAPRYTIWASPFKWGFYPKWWKPWRIHPRHVFIKTNTAYRVHYHRVPTRNVLIVRSMYVPARSALMFRGARRGGMYIKPYNRGFKSENRRGRR